MNKYIGFSPNTGSAAEVIKLERREAPLLLLCQEQLVPKGTTVKSLPDMAELEKIFDQVSERLAS
ncbi:MAG: hypothetical protein AAF429_14595 [Pseudomonadota bacterium]